MIVVGNILVSEEIRDTYFICDLQKCFGSCCVEGDAGAPLDEEEITELEDNYPYFKKYMTQKGIDEVEKNGLYDFDEDGSLVTPLIDHQDCAFIRFEKEIAKCAIEKAYEEGQSDFRKPISCHLYPVRIIKNDKLEGVNYHNWQICQPARKLGKKAGTPLYKFLKEALIRKYGLDWYNLLIKEIEDK